MLHSLRKDNKILEVDNLTSSQVIGTVENNDTEISKSILNHLRNTRGNYLLAEELALLKINQEIDGELIKDMKYVSKKGKKIFFDAVIKGIDKITFVKIKYIPDTPGYILSFNPIRKLIESLKDSAPPNSTLLFGLVTEGTIEDPHELLNNLHSLKAGDFSFNIIFKLFCLKELENEFHL